MASLDDQGTPPSVFLYVALSIGIVFAIIFGVTATRYWLHRRRQALMANYLDYEAGLYPQQGPQGPHYVHRHTESTESAAGHMVAYATRNAYPYNIGASGNRRAYQQARAAAAVAAGGGRRRRDKKLMTQEQMDARYPAMKFRDAVFASKLTRGADSTGDVTEKGLPVTVSDAGAPRSAGASGPCDDNDNDSDCVGIGARGPHHPQDAVGPTLSGTGAAAHSTAAGARHNEAIPLDTMAVSSSTPTSGASCSSVATSLCGGSTKHTKGGLVSKNEAVNDPFENDNDDKAISAATWKANRSKHMSLLMFGNSNSNISNRSTPSLFGSHTGHVEFDREKPARSHHRKHKSFLASLGLVSPEPEQEEEPRERNRHRYSKSVDVGAGSVRLGRLDAPFVPGHARSSSVATGADGGETQPTVATRRVAAREGFVRHSTPNVGSWGTSWGDHGDGPAPTPEEEEYGSEVGSDVDSDSDTSLTAAQGRGLVVENDLSTCVVCIDDMEPEDDVRVLACGHIFHDACIGPWLLSRRACCPMCKHDLYAPKPLDPLGPDPPAPPQEENGRPDGMMYHRGRGIIFQGSDPRLVNQMRRDYEERRNRRRAQRANGGAARGFLSHFFGGGNSNTSNTNSNSTNNNGDSINSPAGLDNDSTPATPHEPIQAQHDEPRRPEAAQTRP